LEVFAAKFRCLCSFGQLGRSFPHSQPEASITKALPAHQRTSQSSLNGHTDRERQDNSQAAQILKAKEEEEIKAFSFQPPLRVLNAFSSGIFEVCILLSV
jgi:hypothetical protein